MSQCHNCLQTYAADIFFAQTWKDHRLRLPENMTSEYRLLEVEWLKNMWRPDSFFKNAKAVTFQTMTIPNHYMWLYKDKTILYMVKLTLRLSCAMNFLIYPHDTQECKLQMESCKSFSCFLFFWKQRENLLFPFSFSVPYDRWYGKDIKSEAWLGGVTPNSNLLIFAALKFHLPKIFISIEDPIVLVTF